MRVSVIGSGVYGLAIAHLLCDAKHSVTVWTEREDITSLSVDSDVIVTNSFEEAAFGMDVVFVLTSSKFVEGCLRGLRDHISPTTLVVHGSKGILCDGTTMAELHEKVLPNNRYAVISGPTFASDVARLDPIGFTIATKDQEIFTELQKCLPNAFLEYSTDVYAVELAGCLKNVYAIGSGMIEGLGFSSSTNCLYLTKVLREMASIFERVGAHNSTIMTLAGVGDLVLTANSSNSRNYTFGKIISKSRSEAEEYLKNATVEGLDNLRSFEKLFRDKEISAPILNVLFAVIEGNEDIHKLVDLLMNP